MHLRLGFVDVVVAASASVAAQFLKVHDSNFSSRPPNAGGKYVAYNYHDIVFAPYGPRWRLLRKISSVHLFSAKALDDFRPVRQEEVRVLVGALASAKTKVNLGQLLHLCNVNALGRMMMGQRLFGDGSGSVNPQADEFKSMVVELLELSGVFNIGDFIPALESLDLQGVQGGKLTDIEIKALLLNMFIAGTETTPSTVEWTMAELIRHPMIMARVHQELDSVVGLDRLVSELDLPNLTYLQAVMKETFRLHPAAPMSLPRIAADSCEINGYHIPKGATLLVNVWAIGRDPNEWSDPLEFRPERFLPGGEKPNADVKGNDFEIIPFGAGRRICAGMSLGLRMVQLMTAALVHAFDWELADGLLPEKLNMEEGPGLSLRRMEPLMVYPRPRLSKHAYST
ncbi:Flavonoid 3'-monooxygenase [Hibiscus syriacus]|uniref:Flavonoid 3'-monooxygenase n=1 Tax=Hibiscus syriacus TaxID=106335 RepID=A0A6A3AXC5_HIBSY|nr:Flavonoid 3'-monooxygenase [Hibiscus syriacus]